MVETDSYVEGRGGATSIGFSDYWALGAEFCVLTLPDWLKQHFKTQVSKWMKVLVFRIVLPWSRTIYKTEFVFIKPNLTGVCATSGLKYKTYILMVFSDVY